MAKSNKDNNELSFKFNEKCDNACVKKRYTNNLFIA